MKNFKEFLKREKINFNIKRAIRKELKINKHFMEDKDECLRFTLGLLFHEDKSEKVRNYIEKRKIDHQFIGWEK